MPSDVKLDSGANIEHVGVPVAMGYRGLRPSHPTGVAAHSKSRRNIFDQTTSSEVSSVNRRW